MVPAVNRGSITWCGGVTTGGSSTPGCSALRAGRPCSTQTVRVYRWPVNPHRKLVTGVTLAELAGDDLPRYEDDAELRLEGFAKQAADRGARFGLARTAAHGALACPHWSGPSALA